MATNLDSATRELWDKTLKHQVIMALPVLNSLMAKRKVVWKGGTVIKKSVGMDTLESLAQDYATNDPLTSSTKTILDRPQFGWKKKQVPIEYDVDVELQNLHASDARVIDLRKELVAAGQKAVRLSLRTNLFSAYSTSTDTDASFAGLDDALDPNCLTYGGITRSTSAKTWWNGASVDGTWTDEDTAGACSIHAIREMEIASSTYAMDRKPGDVLVVVSPTNFLGLKTEMETRLMYKTDGRLAKQGFQAMTLDNIEIVADPYLNTSSTLKTKVYLLNLPDWELRIHPNRSFKLTDAKWQGDIVNGFDKWLSRCLLAGNFVCWQPNASCYKTKLSA